MEGFECCFPSNIVEKSLEFLWYDAVAAVAVKY
jgi:hypothetical protein